ncbi:MAG: hypothetical protein JXB48_14260 [Candidatus Latescibacteria bacterium]|nr:hypothetical protein [Candidatus Latescibacterota bacterium]
MKNRYLDKTIPFGTILAVGLVHCKALNNLFVADTWVFIYPHSLTETFSYFFKSIIPPEWKSLWFRPIPMFFFWFDNILWPGKTWGPHLTNIIFHVINVYLIWLLVGFMTQYEKIKTSNTSQKLPSFAASLCYGLHPLTVGSVSWVAARFDVMSVTCGLAGLLLWLKWDIKPSERNHLTGAVVLLAVALLCKEQGVVFITVCLLVTFFRLIKNRDKKIKGWPGLLSLALLMVIYTIYRLIIFGGLGGYITAQHGLNFIVPVYYFFALFFPFLNVLPGWTISVSLLISLLVLWTLVPILWTPENNKKSAVPKMYIFAACALFFIGLITTAPHAGMTFDTIIRHAESRFALIPVVGFSLIAGIMVYIIIQNNAAYKFALVCIVIIGSLAAWRTDIQIQAWGAAGKTADSIISQTLMLVPSPKINSKLIFLDIPRNNSQYAYIFGIGFKEALQYKYGLRKDLDVIRYPKRNDLRTANPDYDHVFQYHESTGKLEKLKGERQKMNSN